jgi:hypothetical protein
MSPTTPTHPAPFEIGERLTAPRSSPTRIQASCTRGLWAIEVGRSRIRDAAGEGVIRSIARAWSRLFSRSTAGASFALAAGRRRPIHQSGHGSPERTEAVGWLGVARARREALTTTLPSDSLRRTAWSRRGPGQGGRGPNAVSLRRRDALMPDAYCIRAAQPTTFGHYLQSFTADAARP